MKTITFNAEGKLLLNPEQVVSDFCTAYTLEEAQDELWKWVHPALLDSFRAQAPERANQLHLFYERLEQLISAVYHLRQAVLQKPFDGGLSNG